MLQYMGFGGMGFCFLGRLGSHGTNFSKVHPVLGLCIFLDLTKIHRNQIRST